MEGRLVLKDCCVFRADGRVRQGAAVVVEGDVITAVARDEDIPVLPGDWEVACQGRLVAPGLVDCHARLSGGLVLPPSGALALKPFGARLELEAAHGHRLTPAVVEILTLAGLARGLRQGITTFIEHVVAPSDVEGALGAAARAATTLGARMVACHATFGVDDAQAVPLAEANGRFVEAWRGHPLVRGALGIGPSSMVSDAVLRHVGRAREELNCGVLFRLAESDDDVAITWDRHGVRIINRFEAFGLLGAGSVAAHARGIDHGEAQKLARTRTLVALSPGATRALEGGGTLGLETMQSGQSLAGLGTAGWGSLWDEVSHAFAGLVGLARARRTLDPDASLASLVIGGPAELCTMVYARPCGAVEPGALADLVVFDLVPPEHVGDSTAHLLLQLAQARAAWSIVAGRVVMREGELLGHSVAALEREASRALKSLWADAPP